MRWAGKPIIRPEMAPSSGARPLPLIHDIFAFANLPAVLLKNRYQHQLEDIVAYIPTNVTGLFRQVMVTSGQKQIGEFVMPAGGISISQTRTAKIRISSRN